MKGTIEMMLKRFGLAAVIAGLCFGCYAQDIVVTDGGSYKIENGATESTLFPATTFTDEVVGDTAGIQFYLDNESFSGILNVTNITITGANPEDFVLIDGAGPFVIPPKPAQDGIILTFQFNPSVLGLRTAQINIFSNDPDDESIYSFAISGTGVTQKDINSADLRIQVPTPKNVKVSKEGKVTVKGKVIVENYGLLQCDLAMVEIYITDKFYLDDTATLVKTQSIKKIKGYVPDKVRIRKFKYKADGNGYNQGYVFAIVRPITPAIDREYNNNTESHPYPDYNF